MAPVAASSMSHVKTLETRAISEAAVAEAPGTAHAQLVAQMATRSAGQTKLNLQP
jgi:hypothetical protein